MIDYENLGELNAPYFESFQRSFKASLESGWYILGNNVKNFELAFGNYLGAKYCIGVGNGMDAMTISLMALDLPMGSEVIVASNTYIATILSVCHAGYKPVLVEPDPETCNICPDKLKNAVNENTRAALVVHLYGRPCQMDAITAICKQNNLHLLEDCAQSHGARFQGQHTGTFGDFGCFSFYPTKNLGALGDAGAIITNNKQLAEKVRSIRNYGSSEKYKNDYVGVNSRLDEVQAGFLLEKLPDLDELVQHKTKLAKLYDELLTNKVNKPDSSKDSVNSYHIYNILCEKRNELRSFLLEKGIKTEVHYPIPPHHQKAMVGIVDENKKYPISERIHSQTLSLPISKIHSEEDVKYVAKMVNLFCETHLGSGVPNL